MNEGSAITCRCCTSLAEGTTSIKFAGGAERTITVKSEVLEPGVYGKAGCGHEMPLQGKVMLRLTTLRAVRLNVGLELEVTV